MRNLRLLIIVLAVLGAGLFAESAREAHAAFHLMRIHAVMDGLNGDGNVQYVELRMCNAGQSFLAGHSIKFYDGSNMLKATFTFPDIGGPLVPDITNSAAGESILIGTSEYNTASIGPGMGGSGGDADFVFSMANTTAANGGDPLHPVQGPNGRLLSLKAVAQGVSLLPQLIRWPTERGPPTTHLPSQPAATLPTMMATVS